MEKNAPTNQKNCNQKKKKNNKKQIFSPSFFLFFLFFCRVRNAPSGHEPAPPPPPQSAMGAPTMFCGPLVRLSPRRWWVCMKLQPIKKLFFIFFFLSFTASVGDKTERAAVGFVFFFVRCFQAMPLLALFDLLPAWETPPTGRNAKHGVPFPLGPMRRVLVPGNTTRTILPKMLERTTGSSFCAQTSRYSL
jgi:hypothetical protein